MPEISQSKYLVTMTWDDAPHLSDDQKQKLFDSIPPFQRAARSKGVPALGAGAIYPLDEDDIKVKPFEIPDYWPRAYGMDVGWNRTAAVWGAHDREAETWYLYSEYYKGQAEPIIHTAGIQARGDWIPGAIDPASRGRSQKDGEKLFETYTEQGLILTKAQNAVEAGILNLWQLLSTGRVKVFDTLVKWFEEFRLYRRDEKGHVIKKDDHLMDATRYWCMTGRDIAIVEPVQMKIGRGSLDGESWMGA